MSDVAGELHLIPVTLGDTDARSTLSTAALEAAAGLEYFIVENEKSARHFLKNIGHPRPLRELHFERFDKTGDAARAVDLLQPLLAGCSAGVLSEAGSPAIADPGALLVAAAHHLHIRVVPHVGPSAIALTAPGPGPSVANEDQLAESLDAVSRNDCQPAASCSVPMARAPTEPGAICRKLNGPVG